MANEMNCEYAKYRNRDGMTCKQVSRAPVGFWCPTCQAIEKGEPPKSQLNLSAEQEELGMQFLNARLRIAELEKPASALIAEKVYVVETPEPDSRILGVFTDKARATAWADKHDAYVETHPLVKGA